MKGSLGRRLPIVLFVLLQRFLFAVGGAVDTITFRNVGGSGSYMRTTNMISQTGPFECEDSQACTKQEVFVSGSLSPFDEDVTIAFRGPMNIYTIGVYEPDAAQWNRVSYWDDSNQGTTNMIFMNNKGGSISGEWTFCGGASQSYASANGEEAAAGPTAFGGFIGNDVGINIMTSKPCNSSTCPGYSRPVALQGWVGNECGEKLFLFRVRMPRATNTVPLNNDMPAIWMLNGQVVRTAQYSPKGCNCRGMGGNGG